MPQAHHQNDKQTTKEAPDLWEMAVIPRAGQPPLRFKGQRRGVMHRPLSADAGLLIALWARRKGDFVLAYSDVAGGHARPQAMVFADQSQAIDHLEAVCAVAAVLTPQTDLPVALSDALNAMRLQQEFAILVGDFLAALDAFDARQDRASLKMEM